MRTRVSIPTQKSKEQGANQLSPTKIPQRQGPFGNNTVKPWKETIKIFFTVKKFVGIYLLYS